MTKQKNQVSQTISQLFCTQLRLNYSFKILVIILLLNSKR